MNVTTVQPHETGRDAFLAFMRAYIDSPDDTDVEIKGGLSDLPGRDDVLLVSIPSHRVAMTVPQWETALTGINEVIDELPETTGGLANLILYLRHAIVALSKARN